MPRDAKANSGGYEITPLALAAARGHLDMVEALVEAKASVNYDSPVRWWQDSIPYLDAEH